MFQHFLRRTEFRRQLTVIISAAILGLALFSSLMNSWQASARMRDYFIEQGQRIAENLARQSTLALLYHSPENAREVVGATLAFPDVAGVQISDAKQSVLLAQAEGGKQLPQFPKGVGAAPVKASLVGETGDAWQFGAPVYGGQAEATPFDVQDHQPQLLGYVHVQVGKGTLDRLTMSLLLGNLALTLSFAVILLGLVRLLTRHMINPLNALLGLMHRAEAGESGMRAAPEGPRDLVEMAHAFNQMMSVLEQREAELKESRDAAVNMAQMKAQFAATVSHEVRTPLNGVVGMLDMLKEMHLNQRQQECVDVAWNSSRTLIDLINNILDFSKMEAGKLSLEEADFDLRKLLEEAVELIARPAQQKGLDVVYLLDADVPARIKGDALRLRQILVNLLGNAVKFTEQGEVCVQVSMAAQHEMDGFGLRFEVRDSGIGMSPQAQQHVFESYVQPDPSTTRRYGGTGLGLAICKQLVELLGGEIGVSSTPGQGTTFVFSVRCHRAAEECPQAAAAAADKSLAGLRAMVLDASPGVRSFLRQSMEQQGMRCFATAAADSAMAELHGAYAAGTPYDVAILNLGTHDDSGVDLATRIGSAGLAPHILLLDRYGSTSGDSTAHSMHPAHAALAKPLRHERLLKALRSLLADHHAHDVHAPAPRSARAMPERHYRVLVAEDNRTNQLVAAGMLSMNGCVCEFASNGHEAVLAAQRNRYDLILMDCSMPEMDGYEATAHIRLAEEALGRRVPIVAMTANTQRGDAEKCLAAGMDDYLAKPITLIELRHKLERWLPHGATPPAPGASAAPAAPAPAPVQAPAAGHAIVALHDRAVAAIQQEEEPPVDRAVFDKLREILGASLPHAILPFMEDSPTYLNELEHAVRDGNADLARARAHSLKGAAGNLGATHLAHLAQRAEEMAIGHRLENIAAMLQDMRNAYHEVATFLAPEVRGKVLDTELDMAELAHVLVVDDDRSTRTTLRYILQRDGFRVEEAADGAEALAMLKRCQPDVILMDAVMPVMDGFTACARMQEIPGASAIPVLMITALQDNSSVERAFAAGASDYIPKPIHYAVLSQRVRRIIEANRAEKRIRHLAYNDLLTGLPNRTLFFELLAQGIEEAAKREHQLAVLFMDLDRFKYVNDNLGHDVGDRLLVAVAQRVRHSVRNVDTVARLGGDEFTVVLGELEGPAAAAAAAHNICRVLATPFQIDGHDIFVTSSVGIAIYPHDGKDVATLVKHADSAMYRAKKTNTGFKFYEASMEQSISEHVRMESDLRRAMEQQQLEVFYQPQAMLENGHIVGMEALVRWRHPTRGMVPPSEFIPLAEETGLINPLGEWVLHTACAQLKAWMDDGLPPLRVAVNISARQLLQKDFADSVEAALNTTGLAPQYLELEITETTLMENAQETLQALHQLRNLGVRLSIDDFGTGYSSLSYLKRFPVDIIKIDRSFVRDVPHDTDDAAIVTAIIALAHSLRLEVVAEGVETEAQLRFLRSRQCDLLQGYHLSPAVPADEFARLVREREALQLNA
ncbi:EAL domain-containing protein [Massilia sp. BJB1822]|uniref:EAL domain-containing protein n=1 Tax=Massilia sp. BJB1822 TaxID=2744470 RepID=UPI001592D07F|nr:EAL domain-containing protein [Massilia sp. BJB1822]NVD97801.1 EAL domain-containing protein [Massilia sp. BJB1822]